MWTTRTWKDFTMTKQKFAQYYHHNTPHWQSAGQLHEAFLCFYTVLPPITRSLLQKPVTPSTDGPLSNQTPLLCKIKIHQIYKVTPQLKVFSLQGSYSKPNRSTKRLSHKNLTSSYVQTWIVLEICMLLHISVPDVIFVV